MPPDSTSTLKGPTFRVETERDRVRIWLQDGRKMTIKLSSIRSVRTKPNGYVKLSLKLSKDIIVPTTVHEAGQLSRMLKDLLKEWRVAQRTREQPGNVDKGLGMFNRYI